MRAVIPLTAYNPADNSTQIVSKLSEQLALVDLPAPAAVGDEYLLRVAAAGVNRADLLQAAGVYPPPPGITEILGLECVGYTPAGERRCALVPGGSYAQIVAVTPELTLPVPENLNDSEGACLIEAAATAWSNLVFTGGLTAGKTVLIHGGSGGVGSWAVQLAASLGAQVLATAGSAARCTRVTDLGASYCFDYHEDIAAAVQDATKGQGVDLILDILGAGALAKNISLLAAGGTLVTIGLQQGRRGELDLAKLLAKNARICGTTLRGRTLAERCDIVRAVGKYVWPLLENGQLKPIVDTTLSLEQVALAHKKLEQRQVFGKIALQID